MRHRRRATFLLVIFLISAVTLNVRARTRRPVAGADDVDAKVGRFSPTVITADVSRLSKGDRAALDKIVAAARLLDPLYLRQVWSGNDALLRKLQSDKTPAGRARLHYFMINKGPWSQLDDNAAFVEGAPRERVPQAGHYPDDMTKQEFDAWVAGLSDDEKAKANGFFYAIRRGPDGKLRSVPYSDEYREFLAPAAKLLHEAASLADNASLKRYLDARADAFMSNDYYESDLAWMDLDSPIEPTMGPYETYSDELYGNKAAFEAYVTLRDDAETAKLTRFSRYLQELEDNLPIDAKYRNPKLGALSPIRVVNVVFSSGEGNVGVQTAAFNLPNDERVIQEKGSKRVMLKNVQDAKFEKTLIPISRVVVDKAQLPSISFDAFFTHVLMHELMHGLGPHNITVDGKQTTVRGQLKELYSAIEEAKADVSGLWALQYLVDKGVLDKKLESTMYVTYLASMFRSVRFGLTEAHGKGVAVQFNYLADRGAVRFDAKTGTFSVDPAKCKDGIRALTNEIMTLQAEGSYEKAKALLDTYGVVRPDMKKALDNLKGVPVDIEPVYPLAGGKAAK